MPTSRLSCLAITLFLTAVTACGSGPAGEDGEMGAPGAMGTQGEMGTMGNPGTPGAPGGMGAAGLAGISCWDLNGDRTCNVANEDVDGSGDCTAADCIGPEGPAGTGVAGQRATSVFGSAALTLSPTATTGTLIPGLTQTLTVPANTVAYLASDGGVLTNGTLATDFSLLDVAFVVDGAILANGGYQQLLAANSTGITGATTWAFSVALPLAAGSHTIAVRAFGKSSGSDTTVSGPSGNVRQGTLTVMLLKI